MAELLISPSASVVSTLGQAGLPFIMPGSGSIGNNGALTLTTPLGITYGKAYVYYPVNTIASGVAAGWYYTTFSSGSAGTIFNNTYVSTNGSTPTVPTSPTAFSTTGPGAYTGSSSAIASYELIIPGNTLGLNGGIRVTYNTAFTSTANNKSFTLAYGATNYSVLVGTNNTAAAAIGGWKNRGVTNAQVSLVGAGSTAFGGTNSNPIYGSIDSTANQTLHMYLTNATPASNNMVLEQITVELLPSVT